MVKRLIFTFVFSGFVTEKEQSQFAAVRPNHSSIDEVKVKDISCDESKGTQLDYITEPLQVTSTLKVAGQLIDKDIQTNDLLLAITPDGGCVGIKVKYGMPDSFDSDQSLQKWLRQAGKRAIDLRDQIESGNCSVESLKDILELKPNLSTAVVEKLVAQNRSGLCS